MGREGRGLPSWHVLCQEAPQPCGPCGMPQCPWAPFCHRARAAASHHDRCSVGTDTALHVAPRCDKASAMARQRPCSEGCHEGHRWMLYFGPWHGGACPWQPSQIGCLWAACEGLRDTDVRYGSCSDIVWRLHHITLAGCHGVTPVGGWVPHSLLLTPPKWDWGEN